MDSGNSIHAPQDRITPLHTAASRGKVEMVKWLISMGADINKLCVVNRQDSPPLFAAVYSRNFEVVKIMMDNGGNINELGYGVTLLQYAIQWSTAEIVGLILARGADLQKTYGKLTSSQLALHSGNLQILKYLVKYGAKLNTSLVSAAMSLRNWDMARWMMESGGVEDKIENIFSSMACARVRWRACVRVLRSFACGAWCVWCACCM